MGEPHQIDFRLDGVLLKRFTVGGEGKGMTAPESFAGNTQGDPEWEEYMHTADADLEVRVPVKAGRHEVGVSFVRRFWEPEGVLQPPQTGFAPHHQRAATTASRRWRSCSIGGPYAAAHARRHRRAAANGVHLPAGRIARRRGAVREAGFCRRSRAAPIAGR